MVVALQFVGPDAAVAPKVIGDGPDGLLLNETLLVFQDPDACGASA